MATENADDLYLMISQTSLGTKILSRDPALEMEEYPTKVDTFSGWRPQSRRQRNRPGLSFQFEGVERN